MPIRGIIAMRDDSPDEQADQHDEHDYQERFEYRLFQENRVFFAKVDMYASGFGRFREKSTKSGRVNLREGRMPQLNCDERT